MQTIRLRINDRIYDKLIWLLSKFNKDEVEIISENDEFLKNQNYLTSELNEVIQGKATFVDIDEVNKRLDSPKRAKEFKTNLLDKLKEIPENPYKYRKSIYFENSEIRDLVFKGYTIVFRINENQIELFGFLKHQQNPID